MTTAQLHTHIIHMQNLYGDLVYDKYLAKLKIGKICKEAELAMLVVQEYIDYMYTYQTFEDDVTYAYSFTIEVLTEETITVTITIVVDPFDPIIITYTGEADLDAILASFVEQLEGEASIDFEVTIIDGILYVYSFDTDITFTTDTTVSTSDEEIASIEATNIQNSYCTTLLDPINCLTTEQLCTIINHGYELLSCTSC